MLLKCKSVCGNDEIEKLCKHYLLTNTLAEPEECLAEWGSFMQLLRTSKLKTHSEVIHYLCTDTTMGGVYPNLCTMACCAN